MVTEKNIGHLDQLLRLCIAVLLLVVFFADLFPAYNWIIILVSAALMYTGITRSCEPYSLINFKTSKKTEPLSMQEAIEYLVGVAALYMVLLLLRFYLL